MNSLRKVIAPAAALLAAGIIGGLASVAAFQALDNNDNASATAAPAAATALAQPVASSKSESTITRIVAQTIPSVVEVRVQGTSSSDNTFPGVPQQTVEALGSGWLFDGEGHVVTNEHVVDGAQKVTVAFQDGTEVNATVVGSDTSTDVAVLKLESVPAGVEPLESGSTSSLQLGDPVIAIGSPLGLQGTVTAGIVSGLHRDIDAPDGFTIDGAVQTDAALNHGNSGGPLLDIDGRVVGMNAQIASDTGANTGIGYAIPIETVRSIADQLIASGKVEHAYLGVRVGDAEGGGAEIADVVSGGPADKGGLEQGDVVTEVDGQTVNSGDDLRLAVENHKPGDDMTLTVKRDGDTKTITVTLGTRPASAA